jgi:hypothetical protein
MMVGEDIIEGARAGVVFLAVLRLSPLRAPISITHPRLFVPAAILYDPK